MDYKDLSPEQQAKARECKTPEELLALACAEGIELSDEEIEAVSGGSWNTCEVFSCPSNCPVALNG